MLQKGTECTAFTARLAQDTAHRGLSDRRSDSRFLFVHQAFRRVGGGGVEASLSNREDKIGSKETICAKHGTTKDVLVLTKKGRVGSACAHRVRRAVFLLEHLPRVLSI